MVELQEIYKFNNTDEGKSRILVDNYLNTKYPKTNPEVFV